MNMVAGLVRYAEKEEEEVSGAVQERSEHGRGEPGRLP
jgi:hypothetical protein